MGSESTPTTATESSRAPPEEDENDTHEDVNIDRDAIADANKLAKVIHRSADLLLDRLLSRLSQFPEYPVNTEDDEDLQLEQGEKSNDNDSLGETDNHKEEETMMLQRGLTIPVSAIAWLSDQLGCFVWYVVYAVYAIVLSLLCSMLKHKRPLPQITRTYCSIGSTRSVQTNRFRPVPSQAARILH